MARGGTGTYTLPAGNPVVTGTTITSTWANTTLADLAAEMTDSLSRSGKGGMSGTLKLADGTVTLPGLTFGSDTDSGLYRAGANDVRMGVGNQLVARWTTSGCEVTGALTASGYVGLPDGLDSAPGLRFVNEPSSGLYRDGAGVLGLSVLGSKIIEASSAGASVAGTLAVSSTIASKKITATGAAGFAGGQFANGTAATGAVRQNALELTNGDINMSGIANPDSGVAIVNRITPASTHKAFARIQTNGAGGVSLLGGMNIASVSIGGAGAYISIILAGPMADLVNHSINALQYATGAMGWAETYGGSIQGASFDEIRIYGLQTTIGGPPTTSAINFSTSVRNFYVDIVGRQ